MKVKHFQEPSPIILIDDFLPDDKAQEVLEECIALRPVYRPAEVLKDQNGGIIDHTVRKNEVVYLDNVFQGNRQRSKILQNVLQGGIWGPDSIKVWADKNTGFELMNRVTRWESVLSRYGDGDFYDYHQDWNFNKANRIITAVYYACGNNSMVGGNLLLKSGSEEIAVEPKNNRLVVFNSGLRHSVAKVFLPTNEFEKGRFSINIWLGFNT